MRVTQNQMTRTFLRHMNTNLERLSKSQDRMTGQKYKKSAENISDTARAYRIRQELYDNELYTTNIRDIDAKLSSAESDLNSINSIMVSAREQIVLRGMNDTNKLQRVNLAQELDGNLGEIIQFANSQFSGRYLFDGSENGEPPFNSEEYTIKDADGNPAKTTGLTYHHIPVDMIFKNDKGELCYRYEDDPTSTTTPPAKMFVEPGSYSNYTPLPAGSNVKEMVIPEDVDQFVDIGAGITMAGNRVEERSAFNLTFSGLEILGFGKDDETGVPKNVYSQLQDAIVELQKENGDFDRSHMEDISNKMKDSTEDLRLTVIDIGTKTQFLEKTLEGLENDNENLTKLQQKLEVANTAEESIAWKNYHALMMATYQFGSKVVPTSLMDFLQ